MLKHHTSLIYMKERSLQKTGSRAGEMLFCVSPVKDDNDHDHLWLEHSAGRSYVNISKIFPFTKQLQSIRQ